MRRRRGVSIHRFVGVIFLWMHYFLFYKTSVSASLDASWYPQKMIQIGKSLAVWNFTFKMMVPGRFS